MLKFLSENRKRSASKSDAGHIGVSRFISASRTKAVHAHLPRSTQPLNDPADRTIVHGNSVSASGAHFEQGSIDKDDDLDDSDYDEYEDSDQGDSDYDDVGNNARLQKVWTKRPVYNELRPKGLTYPAPGKYGDPTNSELWDWYVNRACREIHPSAFDISTARIRESCRFRRPSNSVPFASSPAQWCNPIERKDSTFTLKFQDGTCRLFIPQRCMHHFEVKSMGSLQLRPAGLGMAPFPIFTPSSCRSAVDDDVGLLDLTTAMIGNNGEPLDFVHIVSVKPSEVENYRMSAPFFVVLELPRAHTSEHPEYGLMTPQELGVGCARHWLVRVADALGAEYIFMLDDSVRSWRGVTLVDDSECFFGLRPSKKAQFKRVPLGQVFEHFSDPCFREELAKFSVIGFPRFLNHRSRAAYKRAHVYSAFVLNVGKVFRKQNLNYRQDLFIWEDIEFNFRAVDVCKCYRFAMCKQWFATGGCSQQVARTQSPVTSRKAAQHSRAAQYSRNLLRQSIHRNPRNLPSQNVRPNITFEPSG